MAGGGNEAASLKMRNLKDIHEDDGADGEQASADAQPLDALAMQRVLASMGADKFEPRVVSQLQEFAHRASGRPVGALGGEFVCRRDCGCALMVAVDCVPRC